MTAIFSVQDETGTVTQLTLLPSPSPVLLGNIAVGDTGIYEGVPDDGTLGEHTPTFQSLAFTVSQVLDNEHFSVSTINANMADWPAFGVITWTTGANVTEQSTVVEIDGANAYISADEFAKYHLARGNAVPVGATVDGIRAAIVKSTDYLDNRYRFGGTKKLQTLGQGQINANTIFIEGWLTPYLPQGLFLSSSTTTQSTAFPRHGLVDLDGNTVNGIPKAIKAACAELAIRVLNGVNLQPDYDPNIVAAGGIAASVTKKVGPLETVISYDTKSGLGFFASFPIVDRILSKAGLLSSGGGRTVIR